MKKEANTLVKQLQQKGLTLSLAESVTCGLAAHYLGMVKGVMDVFKGSIVCYHPEAKKKALCIPARLIRKHTPESQPVTDAMVNGLSQLFDTDIYAAVTGLAANGGSESKDKPVGTIFFSVRFRDRMHRAKKRFRGSPLEIEEKSCKALYRMIVDITGKRTRA